MTPARPLALVLPLALCLAAAACESSKGSGTGGATSSTVSSTSSGSGSSTSGSSSSTGSSTGGSTSSSSGTGGEDPTSVQCLSCLQTACSTEKTACNADCYAIQACIDAVCDNLSATGATTEGACQAYCEGLHPNGKASLIAYATCTNGATNCNPPCAGPPYDYDQCAGAQIAGPCKSAHAACTASSACASYQTCVGACTTDTDCEACGMGTSGAAGQMLYEALELCIDQTCLPLYWVPSGP
jgi:hypothetical protein